MIKSFDRPKTISKCITFKQRFYREKVVAMATLCELQFTHLNFRSQLFEMEFIIRPYGGARTIITHT